MGRILKKLKYFWDCRTFASQLTAVFLVVFFVLVVILGGTGSYLFRQILESKIEESFQQTLRQTGKNIDTTLSIYKDSISQLAIDRDLLWNLKNLDLKNGNQETGGRTAGRPFDGLYGLSVGRAFCVGGDGRRRYLQL